MKINLFPLQRNLSRMFILCTFIAAPALSSAQADPEPGVNKTHLAKANELIQNASFSFVKNMGQYDHLTDQRKILYSADAPGAMVWLTNTGITYVLVQGGDMIKHREEERDNKKEQDIRYHRVDMNFLGTEITAGQFLEDEKADEYNNYYYPSHPDGIHNVPLFRKLTVSNLYEGIDWVIYCNGTQGLKFDFIVHPGADVSKIRYAYVGADKISMSENHQGMVMQTSLGELKEGQLISYYADNRAEAESRFILKDNVVSIELPERDDQRTVVIDPPIIWGTHNGGAWNQGAIDCVNDNLDNMYTVGYTFGDIFPLNPGGGAWYQGTNPVNMHADGCIFKFSPTCKKLWATYYGGITALAPQTQANDLMRDVAYVSSSNTIVVVGNTGSTDFPLPTWPQAPYQGTFAGGWTDPNGIGGDGFFLRFNQSGWRLYGTYFGGTGEDQFNAVCTASTGNVYITGSTKSSNFPVAYTTSISAANQPAYGGGAWDALIVAFNSSNQPIYGSYDGGTGDDKGLCIDANDSWSPGWGRVYMGGSTTGGFPIANAAPLQAAFGGNVDGFMVRHTITATVVRDWAAYHGGSGADRMRSVFAYSPDKIYWAEEAGSNGYSICNPAYFYKGGLDVYFFRISDNAGGKSFVLGEYFGTAADDSPWDIIHQNSSVVYLVGETRGAGYIPIVPTPAACDYDQANFAGTWDGFIMKIDDCAITWSTYFGGDASDWLMGGCVDSKGCLYVVGEMHSTVGNLGSPTESVNPGGGAWYQGVMNGNHEQVFAKYCDCPQANAGPDASDHCPGGAAIQIGISPNPLNTCLTYSWSPTTGLNNPNIPNPTYTSYGLGTYNLTLTITSVNPPYCQATDVMSVVVTSSGCRLAHNDSTAKGVLYEIFPNPTVSEVNIEFTPGQGQTTIEVFNTIGQSVAPLQTVNENRTVISLADQPNGVYIARITIKGTVYIERIVKKD